MDMMFYNCANLNSLNISSFDTSSVESMYNLFSGCRSLLSIDLSNFDTKKVTDMHSIFSDCTKLVENKNDKF